MKNVFSESPADSQSAGRLNDVVAMRWRGWRVLLGVWLCALFTGEICADTLLSRSVYSTAGGHVYTVSAGTTYLIVKCWGGGGGSYGMGGFSYGGSGGYVSGKFLITSGTYNLWVGGGGNSGGGNGGDPGGVSVFDASSIRFGAGGGGGGSGGSGGWYNGADGGGANQTYSEDGGAGGPDYGGTGGNNGQGGGTVYDFVGSGPDQNDPEWASPAGVGAGYIDFVGHAGRIVILAYQVLPTPSITSSLAQRNRAQNQSDSYTITATQSPTSYGASNLPPGLSINTSTGVLSGSTTTPGTYNATITATNASGPTSATLTWVVTAASITPNASVVPNLVQLGNPVQLYRDGTANFGASYTDGTVWRPNGSSYSLGILPFGSLSYSPDGGAGTYWYQFRLVDSYGNYADQWIAFYVADINPLTVTTSGGQTYDGRTTNPVINFGQSVTVNATAHDPSGQMIYAAFAGDFGIAGNWAGYGGTVSFSPTTAYSFSTTYQPTARGTGSHWMAAFGYSNFWWGRGYNLIVNKATPASTFPHRSLAPGSNGYYTVGGADLNASFANPYSAAVAAPAGTVTYRLSGSSYTVTPGTQLASGNAYSVDAVYPGDNNYNAVTPAAAFTVLGPTLPTSFQPGTTGSTFVTLSWAASTSSSGINHYDVYRNGVLVGSPTTAAFTDSTASASTGYTYTVKAVDNSGYVSAVASLSVTTASSFELFTPLP